MDYIEKLFKQYPFIYCIGDKYYAFGTGVCSECDMSSVLLKKKYRVFEESLTQNLTVEEAWKVFHRLIFEAECVRDDKGICYNPQKEILNFHFEEKEIKELERQVQRYIDYWEKYAFNNYLH